MVEIEISGKQASRILMESKSINDVNGCNKCRSYERYLKEALEELVSLPGASELPQKEMVSYTTPETTWKSNKDPTLNNGDVSVNSEWSLKTANHRMVKPWKRDQSANLNTGEFIKTASRYTPLTEMHADNIGTIAVIVNGYISTNIMQV
jgi:hypothetical protein